MKALRLGEHEHEARPGLPEALPAGERLLWQGTPDGRLLARHGLHLRGLALYFALLLAWRAASAWADGANAAVLLGSLAWPLPLALLALGFVLVLAGLVQRTTVYTVTDRRVVMRIGIVLTVTFNLPLARIDAVQLKALGSSGAGDIALQLNAQDHIGLVHLWPHARPWHWRHPQPTLRALPDAAAVARVLAAALQGQPVAALATPAAPAGSGPAHDALPQAA